MAEIEKLQGLRRHFESGITLSYEFRRDQLKKLKKAILASEQEFYDALYADLKKSPEECWVTEIGMVIAEISVALKNLQDWMRSEKVSTNLLNLPSSSKVIREPLGVVMIIAPWNYPMNLLFMPLVGAIAAGNVVVLKPSEYAPATAKLMGKLITDSFGEEYILYVEGDGASVIPAMMEEFTFDHIFYTGSTSVGRIIYKLAADKLTPVTLELGGKSPCVVEDDADIKVTAKRIAVTKFSNAGQMCVAPDFVLVHESKKIELLHALKDSLKKFFSEDASTCYNYGKMINEKQFDRVANYLKQGKIEYGGNIDRRTLYIEPTILVDVDPNADVMKDEIFGPVLPVISFTDREEARKIIQRQPNPLSFYIYSQSGAKQDEWIRVVPSGGACINNSSWHLTNHNLPFGGRGASGTGNYHGKYSFETFSHRKAVMKTPTWFDPAMKYPPFKGKLKLLKWLIK